MVKNLISINNLKHGNSIQSGKIDCLSSVPYILVC